MREASFELCAETLDACLVAREGGADRIELCSALSEDGLTPSHALIRAAVQQSGLPVYVLLRPRGGDFVYSERELALMRDDLLHARDLGVSGFALGLLRTNGTVDVERTRELVALAAPLEVTFHRAFDVTLSLDNALEDVITTGCRRLLTSGGERDVVAGAANLAWLVERAGERIAVAAGGGLRIPNAAFVAKTTQARHFHGSARRRVEGVNTPTGEKPGPLAVGKYVVDPADIRAMIDALKQG
jgi:copper homeostasis protein